LNIGKLGQGIHSTKIGADSQAKKYPKCLKKVQPKLSAQAPKVEIFEKKLSLGVRSSWVKLLSQVGFIIRENASASMSNV